MNPRNVHPLEFFNEWLVEPIEASDYSVIGIMDALNRHPISQDENAQDYIMPASRYREEAGRFRIFSENQDGFYCFVYAGDETKIDPPVYFETCLDLEIDHGFKPTEIIENNHVLLCERFSDCLWQMLGMYLCIRDRSSDTFIKNVNGIIFDRDIKIDNSFINPIGRDFPSAFTCFISKNAICAPDWGAAFLNAESRTAFISKYSPLVSQTWE